MSAVLFCCLVAEDVFNLGTANILHSQNKDTAQMQSCMRLWSMKPYVEVQSPSSRHVERISCSEACLSPDQQQRCLVWVYVYWFDHGKPVTWALQTSRGSCQSFGSIFVRLVPGRGVVSSSLKCLLWVTYVDLPILHSLASVAMATRAVNAVTTGERD